MKLLGFLSHPHKPDIGALSALVDGALDAAAVQALESHTSGCAACATELDGLRRVKAMLAALPQVEPTRSFRLRRSDVEAPAPRVSSSASGLLRAMPALAAVAAAVFVGTLATDFSTRDGGGRQATARVTADSAAESLSMDDRALEFGADQDATIANSEAPAAGALVGTPADADGAAGAVAPQPGGAAEPPVQDAFEGEEDGAGVGGSDNATRLDTKQMDTIEAARAQTSDDDDGNRSAFLAVEVIAGVVLAAAAAGFVVNRRKTREGQV